MTVMEIKARIEQLETQVFYINMTDHWTNADRELLRKVEKELRELKEKLN